MGPVCIRTAFLKEHNDHHGYLRRHDASFSSCGVITVLVLPLMSHTCQPRRPTTDKCGTYRISVFLPPKYSSTFGCAASSVSRMLAACVLLPHGGWTKKRNV